MKKIISFGLAFITVLVVLSCSSDDDSGNSASFKVDGITYNLPPVEGVMNVISPNAIEVNGNLYNRNTVIINGINGTSRVATVTFDLFVRQGQPLAGDYQISTDQNEDNPVELEALLSSNDRACLGWTSLIAVNNLTSQSTISGNAPTGTVKLISNGGTNYRIQFNGNFKNINQVSDISVEINLTGNLNN